MTRLAPALIAVMVLVMCLGFVTTGHCQETNVYTGAEFLVTDTDKGEDAISAIAITRVPFGSRLALAGRIYLGELESTEQLGTFQSLEAAASLNFRVARIGTNSLSTDVLYAYTADVTNGGGYDAYGAGLRLGDAKSWLRVYAAYDETVGSGVHPGVSVFLQIQGPFYFSADRLFAERGRNRVGIYFQVVK